MLVNYSCHAYILFVSLSIYLYCILTLRLDPFLIDLKKKYNSL